VVDKFFHKNGDKMNSDLYDVHTVALALNLGEVIFDSFQPQTEELNNQLFLIAWKILFQTAIDEQKLDKSINYYVFSHDEKVDDPYSMPEYSRSFPDNLGAKIEKVINLNNYKALK